MQCCNRSERLWLLSICLEVLDDHWGIFHFMGYWKGLKIKRIYICSQERLFWMKGEVYLIRMEVTDSDIKMNCIKGVAIESKKIDLGQVSWEPF
jgi:hypothetical protein